MQTFHSVFFYLIFTTGTSLGVAYLLGRFVKEPRDRAKLFLLPIVLPLVSFLVTHFLHPKVCGIDRALSWSGHFLCALESFFFPYVIAAITISLLYTVYCLIRRTIGYRKWLGLTGFDTSNEAFAQLVQELCVQIGVALPRIFVMDLPQPVCAVFGIFRKNLVVSRNLLEMLEREELQGIVAHELAHMQRKDNILGWVWSLLKDLLVFSPFAVLSYRLYRREVERDCDERARRWLGGGYHLASALVKHAKLGQAHLSINPTLYDGKSLTQRVSALLGEEPKDQWGLTIIAVTAVLLFIVFRSIC